MPPRDASASNLRLALLALAALGCASDATVSAPPAVDDSHMYWALTLDHRAVTLSTAPDYDTIRLTATPRNVAGQPLSDFPAPTYTSLDLEHVQVDADGLVHAIASGNDLAVVASLTQDNHTHSDTVLINVTEDASPPPALATFSIQPIPGDSAKTSTDVQKSLQARTEDASGTPIVGLAVDYRTSDPTTATIDRSTGVIQPIRPGRVIVVATGTAYGITKGDTLSFTIGYPVTLLLSVALQQSASGQQVAAFVPNHLVMGTGGVVLIFNPTTVATDITFDDPANVAQADEYCGFLPDFCGSGNIEPFASNPDDPSSTSGNRARRFPVPGTYRYHSTIFGTTGAIDIVDERPTP
jgi:hypothetical protein